MIAKYLARLDKLKDLVETPVDKEIRRPLIALWLHGFETQNSCAGHPEQPGSYPFIWISCGDVPDASSSDESYIKKKNETYQKLVTLLIEFYSTRDCSYPYQLVLQHYYHGLELMPCAGYADNSLVDGVFCHNSQQEMQAFTDFLLEKKFGDKIPTELNELTVIS